MLCRPEAQRKSEKAIDCDVTLLARVSSLRQQVKRYCLSTHLCILLLLFQLITIKFAFEPVLFISSRGVLVKGEVWLVALDRLEVAVG